MRLQALNHFDSPPSPAMITQKRDVTGRDSVQFIKESHFSTQLSVKKDCLVLSLNEHPDGLMRNMLVKLSFLPQDGRRWV